MKLIRLIVFVALWAGTLEAKPRTCRIIFPDRPNGTPQAAYLHDGTKSHSVSLPSMNFSAVIELPEGDLTVALTPEQVEDGKAMPPTARQLQVPKEVIDFYILITADEKLKEFPLKLHLIDVSEGKMGAGETVWYNSTGHRIKAELGDTRLALDPEAIAVSSKPTASNGYYRASLTYQKDGQGDFLPFAEQQWRNDEKSRHLGFVASNGGKLPRIFLYRDFRNP